MKLYGLRTKDTHEMIGLYTESNSPAEFCEAVCFKIGGEIPYLVIRKEIAEKALREESEWFSAGYYWPIIWKELRNNLEIFEIEIPCKGFYLC